jgi:Flp pilus assembly protein TadD
MAMTTLENLLKLLDTPRDGALLRFSLGSEFLKAGDIPQAVAQLRLAVAKDPKFSAAWKVLGKALADMGDLGEALTAYRQGIAVAEARGDVQAAKEMKVFARRLERAAEIEKGRSGGTEDRDPRN